MKILIAGSIMVYFILLIILILNIEEKSKIIKSSFFLFIIVLFIALFLINEIIMDYLISIIIRYFYFPTFSSIILTIIVTMVILMYNIFDDYLSTKKRIVNYVFTSFIFIGYILFAIQNIDVNSYNALYNENSLICLRYISRTFILWMIVIGFIKYFSYFGRKG